MDNHFRTEAELYLEEMEAEQGARDDRYADARAEAERERLIEVENDMREYEDDADDTVSLICYWLY